MNRLDNLSCQGCIHILVRSLTGIEPKHCSHCIRSKGVHRLWSPGPGGLLRHITDCYIKPNEGKISILAPSAH